MRVEDERKLSYGDAVLAIPGFAAFTPEAALMRMTQGFRFLTAGTDASFMLGGARAGLEMLGLKNN